MARRQTIKHVAKNIDGVTHIIPRKQKRWPKLAINVRFIAVIGILLSIGICVFIVSKVQGQPNLENPTDLKKVLSRHIIVPNEQPVIATVTDTTALKTPFLKESQNGDKIIIYEKARRVVIYRPTLDRIVDIGPVELDNIPKS